MKSSVFLRLKKGIRGGKFKLGSGEKPSDEGSGISPKPHTMSHTLGSVPSEDTGLRVCPGVGVGVTNTITPPAQGTGGP